MNWVRRKLFNWLNANENQIISKQSTMLVEADSLGTEPIRLSIYRANGGTVVETRVYDRQKDRSQSQLHIVGHDQDLGHSLSKIITMESLRG